MGFSRVFTKDAQPAICPDKVIMNRITYSSLATRRGGGSTANWDKMNLITKTKINFAAP